MNPMFTFEEFLSLIKFESIILFKNYFKLRTISVQPYISGVVLTFFLLSLLRPVFLNPDYILKFTRGL